MGQLVDSWFVFSVLLLGRILWLIGAVGIMICVTLFAASA